MKRIVSIFVALLFSVLALNVTAQNLSQYGFTMGVDGGQWIPLTSPTTLLGAGCDDEASGLANIGFSFVMGSTPYTQFSVNSNGNFRLGGSATTASNYSTPFNSTNANANNPKIVGVGRDISTNGSGYVKYQVFGTAPNRILVCEFLTTSYYSNSTSDVNWQIQLFEGSNNFQIVYGSTTPASIPSSFQIGACIDNTDVVTVNPSTDAVSYGASSSTYSTWPGANCYYRFTYPVYNSVQDLSVDDIAYSSAVANWSMMSQATSYSVQYNGVNTTVSDNSCVLSGLQPATTYTVTVTPQGIDNPQSESVEFTTLALQTVCVQGIDADVEISSASMQTTSSNSYSAPVNNYYNYSYTQQIFTPEEIGSAGQILNWSVYYNYSSSSTKNNVNIYLAHRATNSFTSNADYTPLADAVLVYSGPFNCSNGWNTFEFNNQFAYNGTDNLVVIVQDLSGSYSGSYYVFRLHPTTDRNATLAYYSDNASIPTTNPQSASSTYNTLLQSCVDSKFHVLNCSQEETISCVPPRVRLSNEGNQDFAIDWVPGYEETAWDIYLTTSHEEPDASVVPTYSNVSNNSQNFADLSSLTTYYAYVRANCDNRVSTWSAPVVYRTGCGDYVAVPYFENFDNCGVETTDFPDCWTKILADPSSTLNASYPYTSASSSSPASLRLYAGSSDYYVMAVSPKIDPSVDMSELNVKFRMYTSSTARPIEVGLMSDPADISTFIPVDSKTVSSTYTWEELVFDMAGSNSNGRYVAVKFDYNSSSTYAYIDNFSVTRKPVPATLPYVCDFEDANDNSNWQVSNGTYSNQWFVGQLADDNNSSALFISNDGGVSNNYNYSSTSDVWAYRDVNFPASPYGYEISFDWRLYGESCCDYAKVYYGPVSVPVGSTVPAGVQVLPVESSTENRFNMSSSFTNYKATIPAYETPTTARLYFYWHNDSSIGTAPAAAFKNVNITAINCLSPTAAQVVVTDMTPVQSGFDATLSWPSGEESGWDVYVTDDASYVVGPATPATYNVTDPTVLISGLASSTTYYVYVRAYCDGTPLDWSDVLVISTPCGYGSVPYSENFDEVTPNSAVSSFPTCWVRKNNTQNAYVSNQYYNGTTGNALYLVASTSEVTQVATQGVNVQGYEANALTVKWSALKTNSTYARYDVGVMTDLDDESTFLMIKSCYPSDLQSTDVFEEQSAVIPAQFDQPIYVVFRTPAGVTNMFYIDDVTVDVSPSCVVPAQLTVSNIAAHSALVEWGTPLTNPSELEISSADNDPMILQVAAGETSIMVQGLSDNAQYLASLVVNCGENDQTITAGFSTPCLAFDYENVDPSSINTVTNATYSNTQWYFLPGLYGWQYSANLYDLTSMQDASGVLQSIAVELSSVSNAGSTIEVWVKTVPASFALSASNTFSQLRDGAQSIYSGDATFAAGWHEFAINGGINVPEGVKLLVLTRGVGCSTSGGCSKYVYCGNVANNTVWTKYQDSSDPGENITGSLYATLPNMRFTFQQFTCLENPDICAAPNVYVSDVTANSATLSWAPGSNETQWEISYKYSNTSAWSAPVVVTASPYTMDNLTSASLYDVRMRSICDENNNSDWTELSVETPCDYISVPYFEDFEQPVDNYVTCWNRIWNYSTQYPTVSTSYAANGSHSLYFAAPGNNYFAYAVLPRMEDDVQMNNLQIRFNALKTSATYYLEVGVMTDPSDPSTFTTVANVTPSGNSTWEQIKQNTSNYSGNGKYIAFRIPAWVSDYFYMDDLSIDYITDCADITALTITNVTAHQANVSWTAGADQSEWEVLYAPAGTVDFNANPVVVTGTPATTLTGLRGDTQYEVYVRAICSDDDRSFWATNEFRTDCPQYMELPYTENFDEYGAGSSSYYPNCWTRLYNYSSYQPYITSSYAQSAPGALYIPNYYSANYYTIAVAPGVDPAVPMTDLYTKFSLLKVNTSYPEAIVLGLMTDNSDATTFVALDTLSPRYFNEWQEYEIFFDEYDNLPAGSYIAFKSLNPNSTSSYNYIYVDDVFVDHVPACRRPSDISVTGVSESSALLTFEQVGTPESWNVEYGPVGFTPGTGTTVTLTTNPARINGLTPSTTYEVYAQANCGAGELSSWSNPVTFSTPCAPYALPFEEDFSATNAVSYTDNNGELPECWNMIFTGTSASYAPKVCNTNSYVPETTAPYLIIGAGYNSTYGMENTVVLPLIENINRTQVSFNAKESMPTYADLKFGYVDGTNFVEIASVPATTVGERFTYMLCGEEFPVGARLAFKYEYTSTSSSSSYASIDDIVVTSDGMTVTDFDANTYGVKAFGNHCWMTENLRSEHYADGAAIEGTTYYDGNAANVDNYGMLYNWYAAARVPQGDNTTVPTADANGHVQGVCPDGWHVPSVAEFNSLLESVASVADLKSAADAQYWLGQYGGTTPGSGFNAIPAGYENVGSYYNLFGEAYFWSITNVSVGINKALCLPYYCPESIYKDVDNNFGLSIRCVR